MVLKVRFEMNMIEHLYRIETETSDYVSIPELVSFENRFLQGIKDALVEGIMSFLEEKPMDEITYTIRKTDGEYIVRFRKNGVRMPSWDYFTNYKNDANGTAKLIVESVRRNSENK